MIDQIKTSVAKTIVRVQIRNDGPQRPAPAARKTTEMHRESASFSGMAASQQKVARASANDHMQAPMQVIRTAPKVGRNDPCPCGSGKKYKNCHGRNAGSEF